VGRVRNIVSFKI